MSMYNVVVYFCLCIISQTSCLNTPKTDHYILCEKQRSPIIECSAKQIIIIIDAIYGRTDSMICPHDSINSSETYSCKRRDTNRVASNCDHNRACLPLSTNLEKDPCVGVYKYLNVTYKCIEDTCMGNTCVNSAYCMHDGERSRCVCPSQFTENKCKYEDTCKGTTCGNGAHCMHDDEDNSRCVCPSQFPDNECQYEDSCMGTCVKYCMNDRESRCVCPSQFLDNKCQNEDNCMGTTCVNGAYCMNDDGEHKRCVCPSQVTENECFYEGIPPDYYNRTISFKTANKTNDLTLLNLKKCLKADKGFLKFRVKSSGNIKITMVNSSIETKVATIKIDMNMKYISVIYVRFDENGEHKTIINNIEVSCNTCNNLAVNWRGDILKLGFMFDNNLVKPVFTGVFKVRDIHLSSDADADWVLHLFESDGPNYAKVKIFQNGVSQTLLICQVFQNCYHTLSDEIVPVLFAKASSKCSTEPKMKVRCRDNDNGAELSYLCLSQVQETNKDCKDILRISACKGENQTCDHCKYHNIEMDIKTLCVNKNGTLILFPAGRCENLHHLLTIWNEIHDESSTQLSTKFFKTSSSSPSTTEQHVSFSTTDNILTESDMNYNQETQKSEIVGLAVGISASVIVIIVISCVLIFLRKKQSLSKKECSQTSPNGQDYIGNQNIAMPWPGDSPEYTDMKVRRESHKYGELKSVNEATGDSCYDVIDANEHQGKQKVVSVDKGNFRNDLSPIPCQEYAMLDPNEKWNTEPSTSPYRDTGYDDYTVLEADEAITSHAAYPPSEQLDKSPKTNQTKNETKMEDASAHGTTLEHYTVLDPKLTGFNRMNDTGNHRFDPNTRDMVYDTTHPLKKDMKYYELAKPLDEDGKENACHKYGGDYDRLGQDSDYNKPNAGHPTYSEEHVYNHTVDDVYDTTSHNKKCTTPDSTYDYFSGDKTDDDYNIPMKM